MQLVKVRIEETDSRKVECPSFSPKQAEAELCRAKSGEILAAFWNAKRLLRLLRVAPRVVGA